MPATWVDFKRIRESVSFDQVLQDYHVDLTLKGDQALGFCPLPGHKSRSGRKSKSFSVNLQKNIFQCFGCQAKGNAIDFCALMEGLDPKDQGQFRKAALLLQERYLGGSRAEEAVAAESEESEAKVEDGRERLVNAPLNFELKRLDPDHSYLRGRGLSPETIAYFGLGFCGKGLMVGRVAIPLHDDQGRLIGYAGRLVDDERIDDENPKYRFPGPRERDGAAYSFSKSLFVFNGFRIPGPVAHLFVVEGFFGLFWLHQCGYRNVVALMGAACSRQQAELICALLAADGCCWIMSDGDEPGQKCAEALMALIAPSRAVRWVKLENGKQPDHLLTENLLTILGPPEKFSHETKSDPL